jgi:F0F1-type ATP synthase delta subunit
MFTLNNYVNALLELTLTEKNPSKRKEIVAAWVKTIKKHHRDLESRKILKQLDSKIEELSRKAQVAVSDEKEGESISKYFQKKEIPMELEIEPELIGGTKIVWDNMMVDNSISSQLDKLSRIVSQ